MLDELVKTTRRNIVTRIEPSPWKAPVRNKNQPMLIATQNFRIHSFVTKLKPSQKIERAR